MTCPLSPILRKLQCGNVAFWCPGCEHVHQIGVEPPAPIIWQWDRNAECPTFSPSLLVWYDNPDGTRGMTCHSFIRAGHIEFLGDCTHALAGQTVPIPAWPYQYGMFGGEV